MLAEASMKIITFSRVVADCQYFKAPEGREDMVSEVCLAVYFAAPYL